MDHHGSTASLNSAGGGKEPSIASEEIRKRDLLIAQLLIQNKELAGEKETQEYELKAQRLTLEEQRNHIEILDAALTSAQSTVLKLETKLNKKIQYEEQANNLQKALNDLQLVNPVQNVASKNFDQHSSIQIDSNQHRSSI